MTGAIVTMLRSIVFIKSAHIAIGIALSGALVVLLYEVIADKITILTWIAVALFLIEGVVLIANGWKCPPEPASRRSRLRCARLMLSLGAVRVASQWA